MKNTPVKWGPSPHMTAPAVIRGRPMCSTEIQKILNRSPTTEERKAYGRWRSRNPDIDLETGELIERKPKEDPNRFMPRSWHLKKELEEILSPRAVELIEQLCEELIRERR